MQEGPEDFQGKYQKAVSLHAASDCVAAIRLYEEILDRFPDADIVLYNHGLACYELERFSEAVKSFKVAAQINKDDPDIWFNLGLAHKQMQQFGRAGECYTEALKIAPDDPDTLYNLACCHKDEGDVDQAVLIYEHLLSLCPEHKSGINNLAYLCHLQGSYEKAKILYLKLISLWPDNPSARHMLAALSGTESSSPSKAYVRDLFDQYSATFDHSLVENLDYRVPGLLKNLFDQYSLRKSIYARAVDLGCGTGLSGEVFRQDCRWLIGVDLSPGMISRADQKQIYDELAVGDVVEFLYSTNQNFDFLTAADVMTYLGDLKPLFKAANANSTTDALLCFSTEHYEGENWTLKPTGRYAHSIKYVNSLAQHTGWKPVLSERAELRKERNCWIVGDIWLFAKQFDSI